MLEGEGNYELLWWMSALFFGYFDINNDFYRNVHLT